MSDVIRAETWMRCAIEQAQIAAEQDEVPVGAVVVLDETAVGRGYDRRMALRDPTAHAEVLALREAAQKLGDWRLEGCEIFVTLEPCAMCAGAILLARVSALYFGATNAKFGAVGTRINLLGGHGWNHRVRVVGGILADDCARPLADYFRVHRTRESS
ncbi:nucleoside deaminase [Candidatus Sumerlaeota bacterium]|nr:nucleoside deaminase [Candidatus Sumerlaeota bacterium]